MLPDDNKRAKNSEISLRVYYFIRIRVMLWSGHSMDFIVAELHSLFSDITLNLVRFDNI